MGGGGVATASVCHVRSKSLRPQASIPFSYRLCPLSPHCLNSPQYASPSHPSPPSKPLQSAALVGVFVGRGQIMAPTCLFYRLLLGVRSRSMITDLVIRGELLVTLSINCIPESTKLH